MAESGGDWCLIESDPGVFTELIRRFGATGVQVEELWSMEEYAFNNLRPVHGLIFLFKYLQNEPSLGQVVRDTELLGRIYFAKQVINNACATQAVISLLMNCEHPDLDLGPELTKLKEFSRSFDPKMRGLALSNSDTIRTAHNFMSQQYMFEVDQQVSSTEEDAYHYVSYIPIEGRIYELDGLCEGPIDHGPIGPENDWLVNVRPIITRRMQRYSEGEIHFNLMALVSDRKMVFERQLNDLLTSSHLLGMENDEIADEIVKLRMLLEYEEEKRNRYAMETARRRHNYVPFIITLLKVIAEKKKLSSMLDIPKDRRRATKRLKT